MILDFSQAGTVMNTSETLLELLDVGTRERLCAECIRPLQSLRDMQNSKWFRQIPVYIPFFTMATPSELDESIVFSDIEEK